MNWSNCYTTERFGVAEGEESIRSAFERDYDRIIFSSAFRRLQNKTQVFPLPEAVFVHNRLTHSLEVVSVGRSLGKMVGDFLADLPEVKGEREVRDFYRNQLKNVISAACLAHDMGNPAFGHSGEEAISKYFLDRASDASFRGRFDENQWEDLTHFEGNANAFRILTRQFNGRLPGGYRLTYSTLAAILKYPCASPDTIRKGPKHRAKYGFFQTERAAFERVTSKLNMRPDHTAPSAFFRHPFVYLVEAADDICYSIIDFEDAHRLGILSYKQVEEVLLSVVALRKSEDMTRVKQNLAVLQHDPNEAIAYLRAKSINYLTEACAEAFKDQHKEILEGTFNGALIKHDPAVNEVLSHISQVSVNEIYSYESVLKIELAGFKIMSGLIEDFVEAALLDETQQQSRHRKILQLLPYQYRFKPSEGDYEKVMCLLDHISAMTDVYALETYRNLRGISMPAF